MARQAARADMRRVSTSLAIGGSGQVLEEEGQRFFQILYGFFFRRAVTGHLKREAARDKNPVFLDYLKARVRFSFHGCHANSIFTGFNLETYYPEKLSLTTEAQRTQRKMGKQEWAALSPNSQKQSVVPLCNITHKVNIGRQASH
jgi:hypothetical protein